MPQILSWKLWGSIMYNWSPMDQSTGLTDGTMPSLVTEGNTNVNPCFRCDYLSGLESWLIGETKKKIWKLTKGKKIALCTTWSAAWAKVYAGLIEWFETIIQYLRGVDFFVASLGNLYPRQPSIFLYESCSKSSQCSPKVPPNYATVLISIYASICTLGQSWLLLFGISCHF